MTYSAIRPYPIKPIAGMSVDTELAAALLRSLADYRQQLRGRRVWLACSGGRDSLALAALCVQLYQQGRLPFVPQLLHIDHGLQAQSSAWAGHVARWAAAQQLPCTVLTAQVQGQDEQAARRARYQAMRAHINQGDVIILAHHADDQAETVLMRLIQGAGVKGLAAMQPWREQTQQGRHYVLWRPWLTITRAAISHYAKRLQLPYIDDPTNVSGDNVRSRLRCEVMPLLARCNANVVGNIARSAQLLSEAQQIVAAQAEQDLQLSAIRALEFSQAQRVLSIDKLQCLPTARQKQLLHYWLAQGEPLPPAKQLVDGVYALTQRQDNDHQTQLNWYASRQHYHVYRFRQQLYRLSRRFIDWLAQPISEHSYDLPNELGLADKSLIDIRRPSENNYHWQLQMDWANADKDKLLELIACRDNISLKITALSRQQKLQTATMGRAQAGKKLYQTLAIPVWLRGSLIVVSAVIADNKQINTTNQNSKTVVPLLLLSPFESWSLVGDSSHKADDKLAFLGEACSSILQKASKL